MFKEEICPNCVDSSFSGWYDPETGKTTRIDYNCNYGDKQIKSIIKDANEESIKILPENCPRGGVKLKDV
jgi:hypothetical protein